MSNVKRKISVDKLRRIARAIPDATGVKDPVAQRVIGAISEMCTSLLLALNGVDGRLASLEGASGTIPITQLEEGEGIQIDEMGPDHFRITSLVRGGSGSGQDGEDEAAQDSVDLMGPMWIDTDDHKLKYTKITLTGAFTVEEETAEVTDGDLIGHSELHT